MRTHIGKIEKIMYSSGVLSAFLKTEPEESVVMCDKCKTQTSTVSKGKHLSSGFETGFCTISG